MRHPYLDPDVTPGGSPIEGAGAEQAQQARARAGRDLAALGPPVAEHHGGDRVREFISDGPPLQVFPVRPRIDDAVNPDEVGVDVAGFYLPGRMPPAGWDGEPGYTAAAIPGSAAS